MKQNQSAPLPSENATYVTRRLFASKPDALLPPGHTHSSPFCSQPLFVSMSTCQQLEMSTKDMRKAAFVRVFVLASFESADFQIPSPPHLSCIYTVGQNNLKLIFKDKMLCDHSCKSLYRGLAH